MKRMKVVGLIVIILSLLQIDYLFASELYLPQIVNSMLEQSELECIELNKNKLQTNELEESQQDDNKIEDNNPKEKLQENDIEIKESKQETDQIKSKKDDELYMEILEKNKKLTKLEITDEFSISDGLYRIVLKQSGNQMSVDAKMDVNGTKVHIWENDWTIAGYFRVEYVNNGKYKLYTVCSNYGDGRVVNIDDEGNVNIWDNAATDKQEFSIIKKDDGYYTISLASSDDNVLTVSDSYNNGGNIAMAPYQNWATQHWEFVPLSEDELEIIHPKKTIEDGLYKIELKQSGKLLNVSGGTGENGSNVHVWHDDSTSAGYFRVEYLEDGKYKLYAMCSSLGNDKVVNIANDDIRNTNIWNNDNDIRQEFHILHKSDGYYAIEIASSQGEVLTVSNPYEDGGNVALAPYQNWATQHWIFIPLSDDEREIVNPKRTIRDGLYRIVLKQSGNQMNVDAKMDANGTKVHIWENDWTIAGYFRVEYVNNGKYKLYAVCSNYGDGRVVNIDDEGNVNIWDNAATDKQEFSIIKKDDGYYTISLASSDNNVLTVSDSYNNGGNIAMAPYQNWATQHWEFVPLSEDELEIIHPKKTIEDGLYKIELKQSGKMLNVNGGTGQNDSNVHIWHDDSTSAGYFRVEYLENGKYKLYAMCSNSGYGCVLNATTDEAKNVNIRYNDNPERQEFHILHKSDDYYVIEMASSQGEVLTVSNPYEDGGNVALSMYQEWGIQHWKFIEASDEINEIEKQKELDSKLGQRLTKLESSEKNPNYYSAENPYSANYVGQCTWYVYGRAMEVTGIHLQSRGSALSYLNDKTSGTTLVKIPSQPRKNSIAILNINHVRFIEDVIGGYVYYTEANWPLDDRLDQNDGILKKDSIDNFSKSCQAYLYLH